VVVSDYKYELREKAEYLTGTRLSERAPRHVAADGTNAEGIEAYIRDGTDQRYRHMLAALDWWDFAEDCTR
jgi:hypothetical protein